MKYISNFMYFHQYKEGHKNDCPARKIILQQVIAQSDVKKSLACYYSSVIS
jgi:hypothetical protein